MSESVRICRRCGGRMIHVHRTTLQRLFAVAAYECAVCRVKELVRRKAECQCPRCGNRRATKLRHRDEIDRMESSLRNVLAWLAGGKLYHCSFCRLQFYDRRPLGEPVFDD